ncbi:hypothetical protein ACH5RR_001935 [Cinchona calisaya]|uniref:C2H2-type domain-containing protein n=1 Tax=Cinchona calisaya TaxID=153742 RepID=A0ABD3B551_9GENT
MTDNPVWNFAPFGGGESISCSACGSTLTKRVTLEDHIPQQVNIDSQSYQSSGLVLEDHIPQQVNTDSQSYQSTVLVLEDHIPPQVNTDSQNDQLIELVLEDNIPQQVTRDSQSYQSSGLVHSSPLGTSNNGSSSTSEINNVQMQNGDEIVQPSQRFIDKGKSPVIEQVSSPTETLQEQICNNLQGFAISRSDDEQDDILIYQRINHYIPENEIGLGCVLLKQPVSPPKESKLEPPSAAFTFTASAAPKEAKSQFMFKSPDNSQPKDIFRPQSPPSKK